MQKPCWNPQTRPFSTHVAWASKRFSVHNKSGSVLKGGGAFCGQDTNPGTWDPSINHLLWFSNHVTLSQATDSLLLKLFHCEWSNETFMRLKNERASSLIARALLGFQSLICSVLQYSVKGRKWRYILVVYKRADKKGTSAFPFYLSE